jgi:phenylpropionate dioxygenase-like ring-hydroxylating dioxygenase large terminal subunit
MQASALRHYWHPVALADQVGEAPRAVTLLGERLVVYRAAGRVAALADLCIHRGSPLSLGCVEGARLVCGYHGWAYDADGRCVHIPALAPEQPVPRKARVPAYRCEERYGLVWVCLDEPRAPIPAFPERDEPAYQTYWREYHWQANAARIVENFMDYAHIPFVHDGSLGSRDQPYYPPPPGAVEEEGGMLRYTIEDHVNGGERVYAVLLPFTLHLVKTPADPASPDRRALFFTCSPITERETRHFIGIARNFGLDGADEAFDQLSARVMAEDRRYVEAQRPEELPLDLAAELHLRGPDTAAVAYRRALARLGVDW